MATYPYNGKWAAAPTSDLETWNTDRTGDVPVMVRGNMYRTSGGSWAYQSNPTTFQISTVDMATAGTNYGSLLPSDTKWVELQIRGLNGNMVSCATISAVSANSYFTFNDTQTKDIGGPGCDFDSQSLWFAGSANSMTMELIIYK